KTFRGDHTNAPSKWATESLVQASSLAGGLPMADRHAVFPEMIRLDFQVSPSNSYLPIGVHMLVWCRRPQWGRFGDVFS
ncbi:MAG: hypothetical protein KDC41_06530, partial [Saprospiraceae bacterium]|nr:hypothetical protein [Saprospiraceae bacterium]